jgi:hypothetical protein
MDRNQKKILIRTAWAVALVWQFITYAYAFPLMVARVTMHHMPGNEQVNVAFYDLFGIFAWVMFLVFLEERPLRGSKVLDYVGVGACAFLAASIVWTSLSVWA